MHRSMLRALDTSRKLAVGLSALAVLNSPAVLADDEKFDIGRYEVVGASLLAPDEVSRLVAPYTGPGRVFGDLQRALEALEAAYARLGYGAVQVSLPEQELTQGVVRIVVVESVVGTVRVSGNQHFSAANIRDSLPRIREGTSPNSLRISENVQAANENPAKKVDAVMHMGERDGTVDLDLKVDDTPPGRFFVNADNTGNARTGKTRLGLSYQHANLFDRDHVGTIGYTTSPERHDRVDIYSASYRIPLYALGDSIDLIYGQSTVSAGSSATTAGPLQFAGSGKVYSLRYNNLQPRSGEYSHRFVFGFDQKEFDNACTLNGAAICGAGGADVTVRPLSLTYLGQWAAPGRSTDFSLAASHNLPGGPHGRQADFGLVRPGSERDYSLYRLTASHAQSVGGDWQWRVAVNGQLTSTALVPGEQLGLVGGSAVRGFEERVVARDAGYVANFEVYTPDLLAGQPGVGSGNLRGLAFVDFGRGWDRRPTPQLHPTESVASAGLGLRYALGRDASLRFDLARVTDGSETVPAGNWRGHFALTFGY